MITVEVVPNTSLVNHAPEIEVSDKTLTVGDVFDPMENVIVKDKEDSANDLVVDVTHNVDTNKAGVYEVTYTVTDTKGATTIKKIYVTVNPKDVYKRQSMLLAPNLSSFNNRMSCSRCFCVLFFTFALCASVSYTHLDVYKRQRIYSDMYSNR